MTMAMSQPSVIDSLIIKSSEISEKHTFLDELKCQSIQSKILYDSPEIYEGIIGKVLNKKFQTIEMSGEIGSILYFEFDRKADEARGFIGGLLWGGKKPNRSHPETIITKGNVMIILSFPYKSKIAKLLYELIEKK